MLHQPIVVVDVAGFTDPARTMVHQLTVHEGLYNVLQGAFAEAGVDLGACVVEDRGDGALILMPPEVPKSQLADQLPSRLVAGLRRYNAVHPAEAAVQLQVVLHAGEVSQDAHGAVSQAVNLAFRMLETPEAKSALRLSTGVLALIASDTFYHDVIVQDPAADPGSYRRIPVPRETSTVAWLRLPDRAAAADGELQEQEEAPGGRTQASAVVAIEVREAVVEALVQVGLADDAQSRSLLIQLISDYSAHPLRVPQYSVGRDHLIELVNACAKIEGGMTALARAVWVMRPGSPECDQVSRLVKEPRVLDLLPAKELQRLREWLINITVPQLPTLVHRAAGPGVPPAWSVASAWEAFSRLAEFNAGADGFPPALMFVELVAHQVGGDMSANLTEWNDDQARRLRLEPELRARRAAGEGGTWEIRTRGYGDRPAAVDLAGESGTWEIRTRGYGDRPAAVDLLHRDAVTGALADLLGPPPIQLDSDRLTGDRAGPTVVALDGPWGSGKTTLVGLVEKELGQISRPHLVGKKPSRLRVYEADRALSGGEVKLWQPDMMAQADPDGNDPPVITIRFEPWAHQTGEQIWAGLTSTLLNAVGRMLLPEGDFATERYWLQRNVARLDRVQLRRTLRKRVLSPFLAAAVLALVVPIVAQMARSTDQYQLVSLQIAGSNIAVLITAIALAIAVIHTFWRYYRLPAAALLPTDLFVGPVASSIFSAGPTAADGAVRDPYYHARSGYLYLSQHDVFTVLEDVQHHGFHLVVFIDDLDRCTPRTTAEVFEAINVFVTRTFPVTRFVLCIDSCAVVAHLDEAYAALKENEALRVGSDPTPGWSFLRKLIQLPIPIPPMRQKDLDEVLEGLLGPVAVAVSGTDREARKDLESERDLVSDSGVEDPAPTGLILKGTATESDEVTVSMTGAEVAAVVATLENDPDVRERMVERLEALPQLSARETKRLLTIWQYYVRLVTRLAPITGKPATERARHLVILAEIISRWPASQRCLHARVGSNHGLVVLAHAVNDDRAWKRAINQLGLTTDAHRECCKALRVLLREYEGVAVADLATQVA